MKPLPVDLKADAAASDAMKSLGDMLRAAMPPEEQRQFDDFVESISGPAVVHAAERKGGR